MVRGVVYFTYSEGILDLREMMDERLASAESYGGNFERTFPQCSGRDRTSTVGGTLPYFSISDSYFLLALYSYLDYIMYGNTKLKNGGES